MASLFDDVPGGDSFAGPYGRPAGIKIPPADPKVSAAEAPRLSRQCLAILDRLRQGRASNAELIGIAQRFGGRVHDLRHAGYDIRIVQSDAKTGVRVYALFVDGVEVRP